MEYYAQSSLIERIFHHQEAVNSSNPFQTVALRISFVHKEKGVLKKNFGHNSTRISSYSECLNQIQYGKNKDDDKLPQLNLLLLFGEESGLLFYYRKLAGNIPDIKTVKNLRADLDVLGFQKTKLVMDRGFYNEENINALYREDI